jgi:hypothetical protein
MIHRIRNRQTACLIYPSDVPARAEKQHAHVRYHVCRRAEKQHAHVRYHVCRRAEKQHAHVRYHALHTRHLPLSNYSS